MSSQNINRMLEESRNNEAIANDESGLVRSGPRTYAENRWSLIMYPALFFLLLLFLLACSFICLVNGATVIAAIFSGLTILSFLSFVPGYCFEMNNIFQNTAIDSRSGIFLIKENAKEHSKYRYLGIPFGLLACALSIVLMVIFPPIIPIITIGLCSLFAVITIITVIAVKLGALDYLYQRDNLDEFTTVVSKEKKGDKNWGYVEVPCSTKKIGNGALRNTQLKELVIHGNIESIDETALLDCEELTSIVIVTDCEEDMVRLKKQIPEQHHNLISKKNKFGYNVKAATRVLSPSDEDSDSNMTPFNSP